MKMNGKGRLGLASASFLAVAFGLMAAVPGCGDDPCQEYVDYMCDCHPEHPTEDCDTLSNTYSDADSKLEDACVTALDDQKADDDDLGHECGDAEVEESEA